MPRTEIGCEISQQLEFISAQLKVLVHERVQYACKACQEQVVIAAVPDKPIEKGLPGPGLLAQVALSKYGDHTPLYRQEDILARSGVILRRSTLCDWVAAASELLAPLYLLMIRRVLQSRVIHTDDTTVKLLDPEKENSITARFWAYLGDFQHPYVVYDFTDSRRRDGPQNFLTGFAGYLQADAYGGYDGIYLRRPSQRSRLLGPCAKKMVRGRSNRCGSGTSRAGADSKDLSDRTPRRRDECACTPGGKTTLLAANPAKIQSLARWRARKPLAQESRQAGGSVRSSPGLISEISSLNYPSWEACQATNSSKCSS